MKEWLAKPSLQVEKQIGCIYGVIRDALPTNTPPHSGSILPYFYLPVCRPFCLTRRASRLCFNLQIVLSCRHHQSELPLALSLNRYFFNYVTRIIFHYLIGYQKFVSKTDNFKLIISMPQSQKTDRLELLKSSLNLQIETRHISQRGKHRLIG